MFISTQSPRLAVSSPVPKRLTGLTPIDLEGMLLQDKTPTVELVDTETRQQIIQSLVTRMRQMGYLRRLPAASISKRP